MVRESDIVNATSDDFERIDVTKSLFSINERTDQVVDSILKRVATARQSGTWTDWDPESASDPKRYVEAGHMDAAEDVAFYRHIDAIACFGREYKGFQRALARHPRIPNLHIWFPKLYENAEWENSICDDETIIHERRKKNNRGFVSEHLRTPEKHRRLVFARVRSPLGDVMYRFKGLYESDVEEAKKTRNVTYRRIATRVKTYGPPSERFRAAAEMPGSRTLVDDDGAVFVQTDAGDRVWDGFTVWAAGNSELHANIDYDPEN